MFSCGDDGELCRYDIYLTSNSPSPSAYDYKSYTGNFLFAACLEDLKSGKSESLGAAQTTVLPLKINSLHVSAYYNHSNQLSNFLKLDVPIVCGAFGSPLRLALLRNTRKCIDQIIIHINYLLNEGKGWISVQQITNDLPELLKKASPHILQFFFNILHKSVQPGLPPQIVPLGDLSLAQFVPLVSLRGNGELAGSVPWQRRHRLSDNRVQMELHQWNSGIHASTSSHARSGRHRHIEDTVCATTDHLQMESTMDSDVPSYYAIHSSIINPGLDHLP